MGSRISVRLGNKLSDDLAAECTRNGISESAFVRQAIEDAIGARANPAPPPASPPSPRSAPASPMSPAPPLPSVGMPASQPKGSRQPSESVGQVAARLMRQPNTVRAEAERDQRSESIGQAAARFLGQPHTVRPEAHRHFRELLAASIAAQRTCPDDPVAQALSDLMRLRSHFGVAEKDV